MAKHTIKGFVYWQQNKYMRKPQFTFAQYDVRTWSEDERDGRVFVKEHSIEVEIPDNFDPRPGQIAGLEAEKRQVQAAFAARVKQIDERIASLLAIEMA